MVVVAAFEATAVTAVYVVVSIVALQGDHQFLEGIGEEGVIDLPPAGNVPASRAAFRDEHGLLIEVPFQQSFERAAMSRFVLGHFVHGVVDGVEVQSLGLLGELELAGGGAVFGFHADAEVLGGGGGDDLAQQLGELGGVLGLFERGGLPVFGDLRVTFAGGGAGNGGAGDGKVHKARNFGYWAGAIHIFKYFFTPSLIIEHLKEVLHNRIKSTEYPRKRILS